MSILPGSGNHLEDALDEEQEETLRQHKKTQKRITQELEED